MLLFAFSVFFSWNLAAKEVNISDAKKVATHFYFEKYNQYQAPLSWEDISILSMDKSIENDQVYYYVFQMNPGGFVMVSAEDYLSPVLGYSFEDVFVSENQPAHVKSWFDHYKGQIDYVREENLVAEKNTTDKWDYYLNLDVNNYLAKNKSRAVEPLITTKWNQGWPYNSMCPIGEGGQAVTGCVATAYAQCLYYWRFPLKGSGYYCYYHSDYGQLCADFENTWYQWDAMTDVPHINDSAVGELMYQLGVALDMNYGPDGSGTWMYPEQIEEHFNVSPDLEFKERDYYSDTQWKNMLMAQLDMKHPMPYVGFSSSGGHMWVCDGYQDVDYYHMNWGWGGSSDGYFIIDNLQGFNYGQEIGINLYPDSDNWTYPNYATGADTLTYLEGSISDGSGPIDNYLDNTTATWLINPQTEYDSISSITLKFKRFDLYAGDYINIYAGEDNTAPLVAQLTGNEIPNNVTVDYNMAFIEFISDASETAGGFYLNYDVDKAVFCNEMTQLTETSAIIKDGSESFYYSNSSFCIWVINPGISWPLTLHFNSFDTEEENDVLKVYDGATQELLGVVSGSYDTPPDPITSPSGRINLVFVTNSTIQGNGWEAWYDIATGIDENDKVVDFQIIPNPTNNKIYFTFDLEKEEMVRIEIIDMLGHQQMLLSNEPMASGHHQIHSELQHLPEGIYFCRLTMGEKSVTKKIVKVK